MVFVAADLGNWGVSDLVVVAMKLTEFVPERLPGRREALVFRMCDVPGSERRAGSVEYSGSMFDAWKSCILKAPAWGR